MVKRNDQRALERARAQAAAQAIIAQGRRLQPEQAAANIHAGVTAALAGDYRRCKVRMPETFEAEIGYASHIMAYQYSFYPGAEQRGSTRISLRADSYLDVLRFFHFCGV